MVESLPANAAMPSTLRPNPKLIRPTAGLVNVTKVFGGTVALRDVSLDLHPGEVLALLGENGAGKSTCVKLLAGVYGPDAGHVVFEGKPVELHSPLDARAHGIAVMHQHPGLFGDLSVAENIFIGHVPTGDYGLLNRETMRSEARRLLKGIGFISDPDEPLNRLRSSEQQLVEIARALSVSARVLIMDEPTAALSRHEVDRLFAVVDELRGRGVAMMFVSHRMEEIYRVADRVTVLRDGKLITTESAQVLAPERAIQLMVGRALGDMYPKIEGAPGAGVLEVQGLSRASAFADVSFTLRAGEIVGFAGLVGSGRTDVARVLFGVNEPTSGLIRLDGHEMMFRSPADAMQAGIAYVSEDRIGQSLIMDFDILTNASLPIIDRATRAGLVRRRLELGLVQPFLERLRLRFRSFDQAVKTLSGGNQQKIVLSKWLATHPRVLILDEPTQGVDVQTKAEVHAAIADLARHGLAILLISSELPELLGMCHRIVVFREGRITAEIPRAEASQERILYAATGATVDDLTVSEEPSARVSPSRPASTKDARLEVFAWRKPSLTGLARQIAAKREIGLVLAIVSVVIPVVAINPRMLSATNLIALAMDAALLMIVAAGQMLVVITRNIDLSVASIIGLAAYLSADLLRDHPGAGITAAIALACGVGLLCGLINGLVVTVGRVPAIVVTLGTLSLYRGIDSLVAGGRQVSADQVPQDWLDLTGTKLFGIPAVVLIALAALVVMAFILRALPVGRELYAIGSNPDGAALIGIRVRRLVLGAFAAAGLLAGFDGALWASRYATIDARVALGYELSVIAAVVVGGVAIRGGAGTVLGVALGAIALLVIRNGLILVRIDPLWLQGVYGLVILVAIGIDAFVVRRSQTARGGLS